MIRNLPKTLSIVTVLLLLAFPIRVFSEQLESDNYKIIDANTNAGGEATDAQSGDFNLLSSLGDFSGDPRLHSTSYRTGLGAVEVFTANVPIIDCLETDTDGSSNCSTGPSYLNSNGMVTVCGPAGCYDRARFEIDAQGNPADTLYAVQISTDDFASDTMYIDGVTKKPIDGGDRTIDDYLTKSNWETDEINILGLVPDTQYWVRVIALHGDFTESQTGPSTTVTTASASMNFDLDIADNTGSADETSPPFAISFSDARGLIRSGPAVTAEDLIWIDAETNGKGGFALLQKGQYGGLYTATGSYTITSADADLDGTVEGFGLQNFYTSQQYDTAGGNGSLSSISTTAEYDTSGNVVGQIGTSFLRVYQTDGPTKGGRMGLYLIARASGSSAAQTDYTENITLVMVPKY